jgi:hypothetical protein
MCAAVKRAVKRWARAPGDPRVVAGLTDLASRTGMHELTARALYHAAALGDPGAAGAARILAADVDNPALRALLD